MSATAQNHPTAGAPAKHAGLRAAGLVGSSIEWYDFFLYGTAAALVFPQVFFPDSSGVTGTLLSFSTFATGFIARPVGGLVAGNFGDKIGRKPMVVIALLGMAVFTFLIGRLPSAGASASWPRSCSSRADSSRGRLRRSGADWHCRQRSAGPKHRAFSGRSCRSAYPPAPCWAICLRHRLVRGR